MSRNANTRQGRRRLAVPTVPAPHAVLDRLRNRVDVFKLRDKTFEVPVMGTFEVSDGKINAWRDYFDLNQFTSQMP